MLAVELDFGFELFDERLELEFVLELKLIIVWLELELELELRLSEVELKVGVDLMVTLPSFWLEPPPPPPHALNCVAIKMVKEHVFKKVVHEVM